MQAPPRHRFQGVGQGNGNEGCDNDEDDEDDEEDGVDGVDLVAPHAGKDVVQLYVDGAERQEACSNHKLTLPINATQDCQWEGDERPNDEDDTDGAEWQRSRGVVCYGYRVEEGEADEHWPAEQGHYQAQMLPASTPGAANCGQAYLRFTSRCCGKKEYFEYLSIRFSYRVGVLFHLTLYV
ncbi:MAG: hypothetical protein FRX49_07850 [Trebouxia sp. A1-2]|nr:MAG: hypothetical protein FRX49_07850 [Trebouxia sp. A1-2]